MPSTNVELVQHLESVPRLTLSEFGRLLIMDLSQVVKT